MTPHEEIINGILSIRKSEAEAIHTKFIADLTGMNPDQIRRATHNLRIAGVPICTSHKGYWMGESAEDLKRCAGSLINHAAMEIKAARALTDKSLPELLGQLALEILEIKKEG